MDADGTFLEPNYFLGLLLSHLVRARGWTGGVARSVATSHLLDRVARHLNIPVYETPVGFKYIGELITQDKVVLGGEESAGLSVKRHVPEKDGILACLLVAEMVIILSSDHFSPAQMPDPDALPAGHSNTRELGRLLYTVYAPRGLRPTLVQGLNAFQLRILPGSLMLGSLLLFAMFVAGLSRYEAEQEE